MPSIRPDDADWTMGDLAAQDVYPDERYMQPPPDQQWPQQSLAAPNDPQPWQPPPLALDKWPSQYVPQGADEQQGVQDAAEAVAAQTQGRYRNALARDPTSNRMGDLAEMIAPQSPLDYALLASPMLKGAGVGAKAAAYGVAAAMDPSSAEASFAGKLSRTANLDMLKKAEEMLFYGKDANAIRGETGWFPSAGGILKYEIPDRGSGWIKGVEPSKLKFPAGQSMTMPMGDAFNHPELYDAYPELANMPLTITKSLGKNTRGGYAPPLEADDTGRILLAPGSGKGMRDVNLHELGHANQDLNNWPVGSNPYRLFSEMQEGTPQWDIYQRMRADATKPMSWEEFQDMAKETGVPVTPEGYKSYFEAAQNVKLMPSTEDRIKRMASDEAYRATAGEVESRNIQTRKDFTPEQIQSIPPHVSQSIPYDKQIIQYRNAPVAVPKEGAPWELGSLADLSSNVTNFNEKKALSNIAKWQQGAREATYRPALAGEDLKAAIASDRELPLPANSNTGGMPRPEEPMGSLADQSMQLSTKDPGLTGFAPGTVLKPPKTAEPYDFLTGTRTNAPYPQFAEKYPETGPPTMVPKDEGKGPGLRPEKTLTPEAEQFATTREKIIKDMRENGYTPFFDPSQRFPAEFSKQPGPHADTAGALAAKQETIEKHLTAIDAPETRQALRDAYSRGLDLPDSQAWYYLGQVERKMKQDLGEEAGAKRFRDQMATAMSATTTGMTPQQNLIMSQYLNYLKATGQELPTASYQTPVTVGGQRTMPNVDAYKELFSGPEGPYEKLQQQAFRNPKRADFAQAQMGNPNAFTVDEQMAHGMIRKDVPQKGTYGIITNIGREEAAKAGADPQRYQDVAWAGFKKMLEDEKRVSKGKEPLGPGAGYQGKPMISEINDMIERTHRLTGMPRQTVWERGFLKNEIPLYGVGGTAVMGGLAAQDNYDQQ